MQSTQNSDEMFHFSITLLPKTNSQHHVDFLFEIMSWNAISCHLQKDAK